MHVLYLLGPLVSVQMTNDKNMRKLEMWVFEQITSTKCVPLNTHTHTSTDADVSYSKVTDQPPTRGGPDSSSGTMHTALNHCYH